MSEGSRMSDQDLLARAKAGSITPSEIAGIAAALKSGNTRGRDRYTLVHILGVSAATQYEAVVASLLESPADPMVARMALQVLCSHWAMTQRYLNEVARFVAGVEWDVDQEVQLAAVSIAGEWLRLAQNKPLLTLLLELYASEIPLLRQSAYFALARAYGKEWKDLPRASRVMDFVNDIDLDVLAWARSQA